MSEEEIRETVQRMMNKAVAWLLSQEAKEGWQGDIRSTCYALQALIACGFSHLDTPVRVGCDFLSSSQDPEKGTWSQNDGETAEALRTLAMCGHRTQDKIISDGINGLLSLRSGEKYIVRSEVGWVHPILVTRAFITLGRDANKLLDSISLFLTGEVGYDVKYASRAVLAYKEAKREDEALKKADRFLKASVNNISNFSGEYIGYLLQALVALGNALDSGMIKKILDYLEKSQKDNGSWENNVKSTSQMILGFASLGLRYRKPSFFRKGNVARIIILGIIAATAIVISQSSLEPLMTTIINIVELSIGLAVIIQWVIPKLRLWV